MGSKERRLEGRNGAIATAYYIQQRTQDEIAAEFGISQARVSQILAEVRENFSDIDKAELIRASVQLVAHVKDEAMRLAELEGAPVTAGKDGGVVRDPETGEVVRDYSGRLAALAMLLKADDTLAKRLGLDAAQKTESTATVRYEVVGVDPEDLK